jgi:hypothetical protein
LTRCRRGRAGWAHRTSLRAATCLVVSALLGGCGSPPGPPPVVSRLESTDWANTITDLDCSTLNRGIEVLGVEFWDIRARGVRDAFVWVDCFHDTSPWPHQLEVFDGSSDPANPRQMAVLISAEEGVLIRAVSFVESAVAVDISRYSSSDGLCCPSINERRTFRWDGSGFAEQGSS